jgi:predicted flap endonuclease-1-like 5' DNA nuclease
MVLVITQRVEATLTILALLLVTVVIGYVTAWLYLRYKYRKELQKIELSLGQLRIKNVSLNNEISVLQTKLNEKNNEIDRQTKEIILLKGSDDFASQDDKEDNLKMISGIGPFIEERLHAMNIRSFKQIRNFTSNDIDKMNVAIEYFAGRIERDEWIAQAKELMLDEASEAALERIRSRKTQIYFNRIGIASKLEANDLTLISGIGGWIEKKLNALDIFTFNQIANFNNEDIEVVTDAIEFFPGRIERDEWVNQAKDLMRINGNKADLLNKIKEKKSGFSYINLGVAHKNFANNLTLIKGISLWLEERLNLMDIFTFEQISKLTAEDVKTITEILEISPNRINDDNWIGQAKEMMKK